MTGTAASNASAPPGFDDTVFIGYSHADNAPFGIELGRGERTWVTFMSEELARRLRQVSGEETTVWRDPKLQGNDVFADELEERLARCAVLVSVCSLSRVGLIDKPLPVRRGAVPHRQRCCAHDRRNSWRRLCRSSCQHLSGRFAANRVLRRRVVLD